MNRRMRGEKKRIDKYEWTTNKNQNRKSVVRLRAADEPAAAVYVEDRISRGFALPTKKSDQLGPVGSSRLACNQLGRPFDDRTAREKDTGVPPIGGQQRPDDNASRWPAAEAASRRKSPRYYRAARPPTTESDRRATLPTFCQRNSIAPPPPPV